MKEMKGLVFFQSNTNTSIRLEVHSIVI